MASAKTADGPPSSPTSADQGEKLNGEGDLEFTITMNESEEEASSDEASNMKPVQKAKRTPSSPVKVNGKVTSDDDSRSSPSKDVKSNETDAPADKADEDNNEPEDKTGDSGDAEESVVNADNKSGDGDKEPKTEDRDEGKENVDQNEKATEDENASNTPSKDDETPTENKEAEDKDKADSTAEKKKEEEPEVIKVPSGQSIDDDVVEIGESPMKKVDPSTSQQGSKDINPALLKTSTAANFAPFLSSVPGTSLVTSTAGMQLVHVQGAGLVYVPSSTNVSSVSSTAAFNSGLAGLNKAHPQSSLLMPQYNQLMAGQNRYMMPNYSQAIRSMLPSSPALTNIPEKPTSSIGMIENIRWEVENHINIKPKYAKPNPKAELGNLTKWIFDLGSDLVKEYVYHDLVRIQRSRNSEGTLSDKEKDDFAKLQEIDKELNKKIGHLKIKLNKSCKCGFRTESNNVLYNHQQHAHIERGGYYCCAFCKFSSRQPSNFKFHMESVHARSSYVESRPSFFECALCPYETNYTNRLDQHKLRCLRQFRDAFNLHPSCVTGPEVNLCLENVFYYVFTRQFMNSVVPKPMTPVVSTVSKTPNAEMANRTMQTRKNMANVPKPTNVPTPTMMSASKQLVPKGQAFQPGPPTVRQQLGATRNFSVVTSKTNFSPNQATAARMSGRVPPQNQPSASNQGPNQPNNGFEVCEICGGYVKDRKALRIHFYYAHRIDMPFGVFERPQAPLYCATCFARFWTAQGLQKHIEVHKNDLMGTTQTSNGVAGKCISCGHRVPNILMHMRMVHNRELRHYLAALMCIFCGSRFATKKEVENHMGKMHGVIVKNSSVQGSIDKPQPASQNIPKPGLQQSKTNLKTNTPPQKTPAGTSPKPGSKLKSSGSQCVLCNLSFTRNVDLTRHCMRVHHTCMKCGLVVVDKESLSRHTCLHSASGMRTCQICRETGFHPAYYIKHMRDRHLRKCSVVLRHIDRAVVDTMKRPITISDSESEESVPALPEKPSRTKPKRKKMESAATENSRGAAAQSSLSDCKQEKGDIKEEKNLEKTKIASCSKEEKEEEGKDKPDKKEANDSKQPEGAADEHEGDQNNDSSSMDNKPVRESNEKPLEDKENGKDDDVKDEGGKNEDGKGEKVRQDENVDGSESKQTSDQSMDAEEAEADAKKQNAEGAPEEPSSDIDCSGKQSEESADRKSSKRKANDSDGEDEGSVRKSRRLSSQVKEN